MPVHNFNVGVFLIILASCLIKKKIIFRMPKRVLTEAERKQRRAYMVTYRAERQPLEEYRAKEAKRKKVHK